MREGESTPDECPEHGEDAIRSYDYPPPGCLVTPLKKRSARVQKDMFDSQYDKTYYEEV